MFGLMYILGNVKNIFAPSIFKILVHGFSHFKDLSKIVWMSQNLVASIREIHGLPGTSLVQPLLHHLQGNRQWSVIELTSVLIQQNRVDEDQKLDLLEMLAKIAFNDVIMVVFQIRFGNLVLDVIFDCVQQLSLDNCRGFL